MNMMIVCFISCVADRKVAVQWDETVMAFRGAIQFDDNEES